MYRMTVLAALVGCASPGITHPVLDAPDAELAAFSAAEETAILYVANTATFDELDLDVGLDVRAARNIVEHRDGADGLTGTADDDLFSSIAELDAVPWVGPAAIEDLVSYAMATADAPEGCLMLSEYIEGSGTYNKAIEVYNCGDQPLDLADYGVCIVRNDDVECTTAATFAGSTLAAGEVHTACRSTRVHTIDPYPQLAERCDEAMSLLSFSGNDRIVLFQDMDGDGDFGAADRTTDMLGRFDWVPSWEIWSDVGLRRCQLTPWLDTGWYDLTEWFTEHNDFDFTDLGVPPTEGC